VETIETRGSVIVVAQGPAISVIVPVFNRERDISACLDSLLALEHPAYEIIVVDNGSTDRTRDVIARYPVRLVVEPMRGAYIARNTGLTVATGEIVAFTDSDCMVEKDWLAKLAGHYADPGVAGVGGRLLPAPPSTLVEAFLSYGTLAVVNDGQPRVVVSDFRRFLSGALGPANMSYRKAVLSALGGFDSDLAYVGGDYDLCWRAQRAGYRVVYDPEARVYHRLRSTIPAMVAQFFALGAYLPLLLKKQPGHDSYLTIKTYLLPPWEFRCRLPVRMLVTLEFSSLCLLAAPAAAIYPPLLVPMVAGRPLMVLGAWRGARDVVRRTGRARWYVLFPLLHLARMFALTAGKIAGGVRFGVVAL